jgi:hypothetical protein
MVTLEDLGERYVFFDKSAKSLALFDIDHNQVQTIDLSGVPDAGVAGSRQVLYITQYLFDLDPGIEVMYFALGGIGGASVMTSIVDESGTIIQSFPEEAGYVLTNWPQSQFPIYETSEGAKLVLSHQLNGEVRVYALPGHLTVGISQPGSAMPSADVKVYPNPASTLIHIDLGAGEPSTSMVFTLYDPMGQIVLQRAVQDQRFTLTRGSLAPGRYVYSIVKGGLAWSSGALVFE